LRLAVAVANNLDIEGRLLAKAPASSPNRYYYEIRASVLFAITNTAADSKEG
jgi:hypothetical protein